MGNVYCGTYKKYKVTITAEDRIGREESITLILDERTAKRLEKAANNSLLREELNELEDMAKGQGSLSSSQYRKLKDFDNIIYNKFYKYELSIKIN